MLLRPAGADDFAAVKAMHEAMSTDNLFLRFFNVGPLTMAAGRPAAIQRGDELAHPARDDGDRAVGVAEDDVLNRSDDRARCRVPPDHHEVRPGGQAG